MVEDNNEDIFEEMLRYVGLDEQDRASLKSLFPLSESALDELLTRFYFRVDLHRGAREIFTDPEVQRPRLGKTLVGWVTSTFSGPYDQEYARRRENIGRVHVKHLLPQRYMVSAMNIVRSWATELCFQLSDAEPEEIFRAVRAVNRILDVDLVLMLSTYQEALLARMQRQNRLGRIGVVSAGVHPALRNSLGSIALLAAALKERPAVSADPRSMDLVKRLLANVEETELALLRLLSYSALDEPASGMSSLDAVFDAVLPRVDIPVGCVVTRDIDPTLPMVSMVGGRLEQAIFNVVENAAECCVGEGNLWLRARRDGDEVVLTIRDDGEGLVSEDASRVFEPFFSTKSGRLGLGLPLSRHLVLSDGGQLSFCSERGVGTEVTFRLRT
jgi:two-component system, NtrC family, sensor histidine kinase HydH